MIGTGLALGLGLAASAGGQIAGAYKASKASKDAAKIQSDAAERGIGVLRDAYSPYMNAGRSAMSTLGRLTTAPRGARFAAPDPTIDRSMAPPQTLGGRQMPPGAPSVGTARPRTPVTFGSLAGGGGYGAGTVMLQSPDGETRAVPAALAERYIAAGATRVQ